MCTLLVTAKGSRHSFTAITLLVVALAIAPRYLPTIYIFELNAALIAVLFAVSLNLIMGFGGMVSFGHAAYYALAAYTSALLFKFELATLPLALVAGPVVALLGAVVFGFLCVRAGGAYFLMLTLAFAQLVHAIVHQWYTLTGGDDGIFGLLPEGALGTPLMYYYFSLIVVVVCISIIYALLHSPFGYTLQAIRDNPTRARALGIHVKRYQLLAFVIAGFFAGVAGSLFAFFNGEVSPEIAYWTQSAEPLMSVIIGGPKTFWGPIVGAAIYKLLGREMARLTQHSLLYQGLLALAVGLFFPRGIVGSLLGFRWRKKGETTLDASTDRLGATAR